MARRKKYWLDGTTCPECSRPILMSVKPTYRHDNYGWWIVGCDCGHIFAHRVANGLYGAAWVALDEVFSDGVCDWTQGDLHGQGYQGTWLSFGPLEVNLAR